MTFLRFVLVGFNIGLIQIVICMHIYTHPYMYGCKVFIWLLFVLFFQA